MWCRTASPPPPLPKSPRRRPSKPGLTPVGRSPPKRQPFTGARPTGSTGHRTVTAVAGTATRHVEVVEFLPGDVTIRAGDTVRWTTKTIKDIHTITFPLGTRQADPIPNVCEASPADTPAPVGPTGPSCTNPAALEIHFLPRPARQRVIITSTTQVASSGVLSRPPAPFPSTYAYTFPVAGRFQFFCHIHENGMKGVVTVTPAGGP